LKPQGFRPWSSIHNTTNATICGYICMEEIWKQIPGLDGKYECSNKGRVRRVNKDPRCEKYKMLNLQNTKDGYISVNPTIKFRKRVHRLVAEVFIPNPDNKPFVNHKNLNKKDNNVDNLEWVTASENSIHAQSNGKLGRMSYTISNEDGTEVFLSAKEFVDAVGGSYKVIVRDLKKSGEYKNYKVIEKTYKSLH